MSESVLSRWRTGRVFLTKSPYEKAPLENKLSEGPFSLWNFPSFQVTGRGRHRLVPLCSSMFAGPVVLEIPIPPLLIMERQSRFWGEGGGLVKWENEQRVSFLCHSSVQLGTFYHKSPVEDSTHFSFLVLFVSRKAVRKDSPWKPSVLLNLWTRTKF